MIFNCLDEQFPIRRSEESVRSRNGFGNRLIDCLFENFHEQFIRQNDNRSHRSFPMNKKTQKVLVR